MRAFCFTSITCAVTFALVLPVCAASSKHKDPLASATHARHEKPEASQPPLTAEERTLHVLNRFTFGPRPADLAKVMQSGTDVWFQQQLNPAFIPDNNLDKRLADLPALQLTAPQVVESFPTQQIIRQVAEGKRPMPQDPTLAAVYEVLIEKYQRKQKDDQAGQDVPASTNTSAGSQKTMAAPQPAVPPAELKRKKDPAAAELLAQPIFALPKQQRMAAILRLPVDDRIVLTAGLGDPMKGRLLADFSPRERELFAEMAGGPDAAHVVAAELQQAKILRAILSERQLQEVMTDFWFNHFNVFLNKNEDQVYTPSYERDVIQAHALGKFSDLLLATAEHPAMLVYLDNWLSIGPNSLAANRAKANGKAVQRGLNENYGREVMELHTVGVNGGYSQDDVTNLSRILTGWTIDQPQQGGGFVFDPRKHEPGAKHWFGQTIPEGGFEEGRQALLWLASRPQTAHFISYKLAQRFVADEPPSALVDTMSKTFLGTKGDIRQVLLTMERSPEFWSPASYRAKVKTPLELVASAFRATETDPSNPATLVNTLKNMGEPLYQMLPPTGYPMTADHWMNSGALVDRLNFSLALAGNKLPNTKFDAPHLLAEGLLARPSAPAEATRKAVASPRAISMSQSQTASPSGQDEALELMEGMLVGGQVSQKTNSVIRRQLAGDQSAQPRTDPAQSLDTLTALILGSPEFQMR